MRYNYATGKLLPRPRPKTTTIYLASVALLLTTMCLYARGKGPILKRSGRSLGVILFCLLTGLDANAQFYTPSAVSKSVGDTLPDAFFETAHQAVHARTGNPTTLRLADYRGKLIILDFWATWCKPCIASLNKLDSMRLGMDTSTFVVVPVTYQTAQEAAPVFERFAWGITSIVADTTLAQIFPHGGIPHMIWIRDGKVLANPTNHDATEANILAAASGRPIKLRGAPSVFDFFAFMESCGKDSTVMFRSEILRADPRYYPHEAFESRNGKTALLFQNVPPIDVLYYYLLKKKLAPYITNIQGRGIYLEVSDSLKSILTKPGPRLKRYPDMEAYQAAHDRWITDHHYSYRLILNAEISRQEALSMMYADVNRYFMATLGIEGVVESRREQVAVLKTTGGKESAMQRLKTQGGTKHLGSSSEAKYVIRNHNFINVESAIFKSGVLSDLPLINETDIDNGFMVDFELEYQPGNDLAGINRQLARYGLVLEITGREQPVLVIREVKRPIEINAFNKHYNQAIL